MLDRTSTAALEAATTKDAFAIGIDLESVVCDLKAQAAGMRLALDHANRSIVEDEDARDALERLADDIYINAKKAHDLYYKQFEALAAAAKQQEAAQH